jgi:Ca2+-binding RTX toxin-like protein
MQFTDSNVPANSTLQINNLNVNTPTALDFGSGFYKTPGSNTSPLPAGIPGQPATFSLLGGGAVSSKTSVQVNLASQGTLIGQAGNVTLTTAGAGQDTLITAVYGGQGNDLLIGNNAGDFLIGGGGNVTIIGGNGSNQLNACRTFDQSIRGDVTALPAAAAFVNASTNVAPLTRIQFARFAVFDFGEGVQFLVSRGALPAGTTNPSSADPLGPATVTVKGGTGDDAMFGFGNLGGQFIGNGGNDVYSGVAGTNALGSLPSLLDFEGAGNIIVNAFAGDNIIGNSQGNNVLFVLNFPTGTNPNLVTHIQGGTGNDLIFDSNTNTQVDAGTGNTTVIGNGGNDIVIEGTNTTIANPGEVFTLPGGATVVANDFGPTSQFIPASGYSPTYSSSC